jgi:hypothetical protein
MNFRKCTPKRVTPDLPPISMTVMHNAPYYSKQEDKLPFKYEVNREIIAWLHRRGVACNIKMRKIYIYFFFWQTAFCCVIYIRHTNDFLSTQFLLLYVYFNKLRKSHSITCFGSMLPSSDM